MTGFRFLFVGVESGRIGGVEFRCSVSDSGFAGTWGGFRVRA